MSNIKSAACAAERCMCSCATSSCVQKSHQCVHVQQSHQCMHVQQSHHMLLANHSYARSCTHMPYPGTHMLNNARKSSPIFAYACSQTHLQPCMIATIHACTHAHSQPRTLAAMHACSDPRMRSLMQSICKRTRI